MFATKLEKYGEKLKKEAMREGMQKGIQKGKQEGKQEGVKEGLQKGMHRKAIQTAKALLKEKMPVEKISSITGLSVEEIEGLK